MDIVLAMLADNAAKKINQKKWEQFPYSLERHAKENESIPNYALYRYIVNNAIRYPQEWVVNGYGAKALAEISLKGNKARLNHIKILQKTDGLSNEVIRHEVTKTFNRASKDFPALVDDHDSKKNVWITLPFEWKIVGA